MLTFHPYRITQDENNYVVQQLKKRKKTGDDYWHNVAYYPLSNLDLALQNVLMKKIADADKQELRHVIKAINVARNEILEAVDCLKK